MRHLCFSTELSSFWNVSQQQQQQQEQQQQQQQLLNS